MSASPHSTITILSALLGEIGSREMLRELPGITRQIQFAVKQKRVCHASCFAISCIFSLPITKRMLQNAAACWKDVALVHKLAARVNERYR
ncbi:hypothetical protein FVF58_19285 [Paraburkholderia panacisoli]|uniref:Uncharacterized protein n=1 Tax=Paraburkholderia panacisoli TaxID=2603818 RepID=A0A5B0H5W6_9BURK|nr:hypothetical protein [Paraburkholderia panacisoli]KAA1010494.1 hypothetical protein FVF58_19285 [Paraburkholderia panacisoli]